jgi:hypothetical protein
MAASGAVLLGLAGCTAGNPGAPSSPGPEPGPSATEGAPDPDREALVRATELTAALLAATRAAGSRVDPGRRLQALHRAHLAALREAAGPAPKPAPAPPPPAGLRTRAGLRRAELRAQRELARLAGAAGSGALARLLASMSAGIAAHLSVVTPPARSEEPAP